MCGNGLRKSQLQQDTATLSRSIVVTEPASWLKDTNLRKSSQKPFNDRTSILYRMRSTVNDQREDIFENPA